LELVVFPGEEQKLHIFEPRYKQLIHECQENGTPFGIPSCVERKLSGYGTQMELLHISNVYPGGELDILTRGTRRFRIETFEPQVPNKLYGGGEVELLDDQADADPATASEIAAHYNRFHELLDTGFVRDDFNRSDLSYRIADEVGLNLAQKVQLLSADRESERQDIILKHLHRVIPVLEGAREVKRRVQGNGHFLRLPQLDL
jgi:Lon protease-like protein